MRAQFRHRTRIIFGGILLIAIIIIGRLYFIQVIHGEKFSLLADQQFSANSSGLFDRGTVYFTGKDGRNISAATLETGFLLAINPQLIDDPEKVYETIFSIASTTVDKEAFFSATKRTKQVHVELAHRLPEELGHALANENIPGVIVLRERWRAYPGGNLAAQTIGIVSYGTGHTLAGRTGLEAYYNDTLERTGDSLYKNFFAQLFSRAGEFLVDAKQAREGNIITTIDPVVEARLMEELSKIEELRNSRETGGIIMDPSTGAIVALGSVPTYDPNNLSSVTPSLLGNPLVEHVYEFGSIMKPLTVAAGLDAGVITPESTYNDTGCIDVDNARICNFDLKARGVIPVQEILSQSLNLGVAWIAGKLGQERMHGYFATLFGEKTGIDLPSETGSLLSNLSTSQQVNYDAASFGQGIAMTPVQMIRALGALANGGVMVSPHLVSAVQYDSGIKRSFEWNDKRTVFGQEAVREVSTMLSLVADEALGDGKYKMPSMSFAAKTGTAQLVKPEGGYYKDKYFHSFFGYFPVYAPRYIILLYTYDPQGVQYASETLSDTYIDLMHFLIEHYDVAPDRVGT